MQPYKNLKSKVEIFTVEGYNSRIRHYLDRFRKNQMCYNKAEHMLEKLLKLLRLKLNKKEKLYEVIVSPKKRSK